MATNEHGLDDRYFKEKLSLVARDAKNYTPHEMFRELSKYLMVAANQANYSVTMKVQDK